MKRLISAVGVLLFIGIAAPAFALTAVDRDRDASARSDRSRRPIVIDDVIRMSQSGVSDDAIIAYLHKYRDRFEVNADDVIAMNDAHVSKAVVTAVVDESAAWNNRRDRDYDRAPARVYSSVYYDPYWYPGYYYDPFWYGWGPRFSIGLRFGGFYGGFHRYHRGRW